MATRFLKILSNGNKILKPKLMTVPSYMIIFNFSFPFSTDGCRQLMWHNAQSENQREFDHCWKPGDYIGSMLDVKQKEIIFYHNGKPLKSFRNVFEQVSTGFFAAASFMSFQQCQFNFGASPFKFPPKDRHFQAFNDHATLPAEDKVILPR